jgi:hypothetical protein
MSADDHNSQRALLYSRVHFFISEVVLKEWYLQMKATFWSL